MSSPIDLTEDPVDQIPPDIVRDWLPTVNEAVKHLFTFNRYPKHKMHYFLPPTLDPMLHEDSVLDFDPSTLLQFGPPTNPSIPKAYHDAIKSAPHPIYSVTFSLDPTFKELVRLPFWIITYWREMESALSYRMKWETALEWLQSHSESPATIGRCRDLMMALSFFPWSGNNISVENIGTLFASSSAKCCLTTWHVDYMIKHMSSQYQELHEPEISGRHIFANMDMLDTIVKFYGTPHTPDKTGNPLWEHLASVENQIILGKVDSVGGAHYLPGHWVSVILDVQRGHILFGCSLGRPIPRLERNAFTQWMLRLSQKSGRNIGTDSVLVRHLPTGYQDDSVSCGLFALNAIGHHYLGHQLLPTNQISLVCARMDIALDLLNGNIVCQYHYTSFHT